MSLLLHQHEQGVPTFIHGRPETLSGHGPKLACVGHCWERRVLDRVAEEGVCRGVGGLPLGHKYTTLPVRLRHKIAHGMGRWEASEQCRGRASQEACHAESADQGVSEVPCAARKAGVGVSHASQHTSAGPLHAVQAQMVAPAADRQASRIGQANQQIQVQQLHPGHGPQGGPSLHGSNMTGSDAHSGTAPALPHACWGDVPHLQVLHRAAVVCLGCCVGARLAEAEPTTTIRECGSAGTAG